MKVQGSDSLKGIRMGQSNNKKEWVQGGAAVANALEARYSQKDRQDNLS
jgi:hypothetical protein